LPGIPVRWPETKSAIGDRRVYSSRRGRYRRTMRGTALVRRPSPRLAEGIVTHIERTPVELELARPQHAGCVPPLASDGFRLQHVRRADDCADSVFIEDAVVVCAGTAVITRPGAAARRPELAGVEAAVRAIGLPVARIEEPGTLDGGDVLQVGPTVYVG